MITIYTQTGERYICSRDDHNHREHGLTVPCMACRVDVPRVDGRWRTTETLAHSLDNAASHAEKLGELALARNLRDDALRLHDLALKQWRDEERSSQIAARERTARAAYVTTPSKRP